MRSLGYDGRHWYYDIIEYFMSSSHYFSLFTPKTPGFASRPLYTRLLLPTYYFSFLFQLSPPSPAGRHILTAALFTILLFRRHTRYVTLAIYWIQFRLPRHIGFISITYRKSSPQTVMKTYILHIVIIFTYILRWPYYIRIFCLTLYLLLLYYSRHYIFTLPGVYIFITLILNNISHISWDTLRDINTPDNKSALRQPRHWIYYAIAAEYIFATLLTLHTHI
jgi:hypothetical protein